MHKFICKARSGSPEPTELNKQKLLRKIMDDYEKRNITFTITINIAEKDINKEQEKLYRAFVLKAANHFGNDYRSMQRDLYSFHPINDDGERKEISRWSSKELDTFINKASAHLVEFGFQF